MTQDVSPTPAGTPNTPLENLRITVHNLLNPTPPPDDEHVAPGCELFSDPTKKAPLGYVTGSVTLDKEGNMIGRNTKGTFYEALDHLESEGRALLSSAEGVEQAGQTILEIGEHNLAPVAAAPHTLELAQALPMALPDDILHKSPHAIIHAFMDVGDVLRNVYLNVRGLWVKQ